MFQEEVFYKTSRSGGAGGQNVNKVETAVEAWWHVFSSKHFSEEEKQRIAHKLSNRMNKDGFLILKSTDTRSQLENKQIALTKLQNAITQSLIVRKARKSTLPTKSSIQKRLDSKKKDAQKKALRKKDW